MARLTTLCHFWPGITPWNVWDLPYKVWEMFAREIDAMKEK